MNETGTTSTEHDANATPWLDLGGDHSAEERRSAPAECE